MGGQANERFSALASAASTAVSVVDYLTDLGADASSTETFVAPRVEIDNWRWSGVPFFLRTGKRLPARYSEIIVSFKPVRHSIFPTTSGPLAANQLIIRLQPDEGISLATTMKAPGSGRIVLLPATLRLSFEEATGGRVPDAYERLLTDVIRGDPTLFMRRDEVEASWSWIEPIIEGWQATCRIRCAMRQAHGGRRPRSA
jgi:glucose-6-phosphate 1-dehydrogenase